MAGIVPRRTNESAISSFVEAFESARAHTGNARLADFVPDSGHPERLIILCELIRVDLEIRWNEGERPRLESYREQFPAVFEDKKLVELMAFEERRLRIQANEAIGPHEYQDRFGIALSGSTPATSSATSLDRSAELYQTLRRHGERRDQVESVLASQGVPPEHLAFLQELDEVDPHRAESFADAINGLPSVGQSFLGFRLESELGRGAFGRVFLARQGDLANRLVALKVTADLASETNALAQLQHTNVVPVYSIHKRGALHAICMPFLGATTLADTVSQIKSQPELPRSGDAVLSTLRSRQTAARASTRVEGESPARSSHDPEPDPNAKRDESAHVRSLDFVPAMLWIMSRIAAGLGHAHDRGILHRDLKPANILFSDSGEPLLLDFNLALDLKGRVRSSAALVGGTLPYMAPEQLEAFGSNSQHFDARADLYALGVILYELLTGRLPFPVHRGHVDAILPRMLADRQAPLVDPRIYNPTVSPAVASIIEHCLAFDAQDRYQSVHDLQEDLDRQLNHRPLRFAPDRSMRERFSKWCQRHPRVSSSTSVAIFSAVALVGIGGALLSQQRAYRRIEAAQAFQKVEESRRDVLALLADPEADREILREGLDLAASSVAPYQDFVTSGSVSASLIDVLPVADQSRLRQILGEILIASGRALGRRPDQRAMASSLLDQAERCWSLNELPRAYWLARAELAERHGRPESEVASLRSRAEAIPIRSAREHLLAIVPRADLSERRKMLAFVDAASQEAPHDSSLWLLIGTWYARLGRTGDAIQAYGVASAMAPTSFWPIHNRGLLHLEMKEYSQALEDFDRVLTLRPGMAAAYLNRALAKIGMNDQQGALADLDLCLAQRDAPTRTWFIRSRVKQSMGDLPGSQADRLEGLERPPTDEASFVARGLARLPGDPAKALADFEAALAINPDYLPALQDQASVLSENLGKTHEAIQVLDRALARHPDAILARAGRAVLLARVGERERAIKDATLALELDDSPLTNYQAACIYALTSKQQVSDQQKALDLLTQAFRAEDSWVAIARTDPDLDPLRRLDRFQRLIKAFDDIKQSRSQK